VIAVVVAVVVADAGDTMMLTVEHLLKNHTSTVK
jgi:hypothetical protein